MKKYAKKSSYSISKIVKLIGKPAFFLFTICVVGFVSYLHLLKLFVQQIRRALSQLNHGIRKQRVRIIRTWKTRRSAKSKVKKKLADKILSTLQARKQHVPESKIFVRLFFLAMILVSLGFLTYWYVLRDLPSVTLLTQNQPSLTTKIYDRNGILLYQIYKDENRSLIKLSDLPRHVINATLAAEDKNFYHHFGVDPAGIIRAAVNNITKGTAQGGSTITQQLIKNTLLSPEKTITRKLKELVLALQTEHRYSKDQILEMYLNQVSYGGTAYGIEQASWQYFGKSARDLTLSESAMIAGLPISPTVLSPFGVSPYLSKIRQQQVLESMVAGGSISENDKLDALAIPLAFHPQGTLIRAPHFVMYVKDLLVKEYGEDVVAHGGLTVTTTLDITYQDILGEQINKELESLKKLHVQNGAGLILNPGSGEILAMVGSHDFFDTEHDGQVNITLQERQPGSSIKPITYALALSRGLTPSTTIDDAPTCFTSKGSPPYCPKNYDGRFHGSVTLRTALASSYNIPATKLLNTYGLENMITLARSMGITTWNDPSRYGLSLTLGGGEIKMIDLAGAYSVFANGGTKVPLTPILSVQDSTGHTISIDHQPSTADVVSPSVAYQINAILSDPLARSPAFGANSILNLPGKNVAVKTGTTNNLRDNWTFGYTKDLLVATWVGNNDNTPMSSVASGITGASPIWARTMKELLSNHDTIAFAPPETMIKVNISCSGTPKYEYFVKGSLPKITCPEKSETVGSLLNTAASTAQ